MNTEYTPCECDLRTRNRAYNVHIETIENPEAREFFEKMYDDLNHTEFDYEMDKVELDAHNKIHGTLGFAESIEILNS